MFIKEITICGFKSYKEKTVIDDFDSGFNIIVGRNGSGKSNLFAAIEFALTLEYKNMRPVERSALLYQGRAGYDPAYVEIVFDNTDRKLDVNDDTVTFRRMIAAKKDKFFVNGKELKNARSFLDMAGFTNPYFIVKQGKVHQLAVGTDAFRLKLLEDVAGSTTYSEKITDCKKSLAAGETKKGEINDLLGRLDERRSTLEGEASELKEYSKLDTMRRSIEYVLNEREQTSAKRHLEECETEREDFGTKQSPLQSSLREILQEHEKFEEALQVVKRKVKATQDKKELVEADIPGLVAEKEKLKNKRNDLLKRINESVESKPKSGEFRKLENELKTLESTLKNLTVAFKKVKMEEDKLSNVMIEKEARMTAMEGKLQVASGAPRVKWLNKEIKSLAKEIGGKASAIKLTENNLNGDENNQGLEEHKQALISRREEIKEQIESVRNELSKLEKSFGNPDAQLFKMRKAKSELWRSLNEIDQGIATEKEIQLRIREQLTKRTTWNFMNGWEALKMILKDFEARGDTEVVEGYLGVVFENIHCDVELDAAVEAAGGRRLLYHIVKNHRISLRLMKEFNRRKCKGEISFIPVDETLIVPIVEYPEDQRKVRPLLTNITYTATIEKAARSIFSTTLVCETLADATTAAKLYKLNCVTLDGDKVQSSGPITGGYMPSTIGKLELQRGKQASEEKIQKLSEKKSDIESQLSKIGTAIELATSKSESRESKKCSYLAEKDRLTSELRVVQEKLKHLEVKILVVEKNLEAMKRSQYELQCRKTNLEKELNKQTPTSSQAEQGEVQNLRTQIKALANQKMKVSTVKAAKEHEMRTSEQRVQQLNELLEEERNKRVEQVSSEVQQQQLEELTEAIETLSDQIHLKRKDADSIADSLPTLTVEVKAKQVQLEAVKEKTLKLQSKLDGLSKDLDRLTTRYFSLQKKLQDLQVIGGALGIVPSSAVKYNDKNSKNLYSKLKKVNISLKDKDGVNQKAAEQYQELSEKYDQFCNRLNILDEERKQLKILIDDLENKKGEAILRHLRVLQEQFREIFCKIVPRGNAELILYSNNEADKKLNFEINHGSNIDDARALKMAGRNKFNGLKINVNFINKRVLEMRHLLQLSGGQKSVVALSLILAIQKIDPVPFYLFDEVDQALDPQYRSAVTEVIHQTATEFKLQFVCTTFRKEFLESAHKFYGVSYSNRCSSVRVVTKAEAYSFVENDKNSSSDGTADSHSGSPPSSSNNHSTGQKEQTTFRRPATPAARSPSPSSTPDSLAATGDAGSQSRQGRSGGNSTTDNMASDEDNEETASSTDEEPMDCQDESPEFGKMSGIVCSMEMASGILYNSDSLFGSSE